MSHELKQVLAGWDAAKRRGEEAVLATVVRVHGSAYRRPGARMLILADGRRIGAVSGGCLEGDVTRKAWWRTQSGRPIVLRYDSTSDSDAVWQFGLGCQGVVDVLIERVTPHAPHRELEFLRNLDWRRSGVVARIVAADSAAAPVGASLTLDDCGNSAHGFADEEIAATFRRAAAAALAEGRSCYAAFSLGKSRAEVFFEFVQPPPSLLICGGGPDAVSLVRLAKAIGWRVVVFDGRSARADPRKFPQADEVIAARPEQLLHLVQPFQRSAAVVMSHNYADDLEYLKNLLPSAFVYVGVLGPRLRSEQLLGDLKNEGCVPSAAQIARLYGPVGLNLGAETPEEIAVAVVAEIKAVFSGRGGGFLRDWDLPLHDPLRDEAPSPLHSDGVRPACDLQPTA